MEPKVEPTDAEISAKTGFGEPEGEDSEETTDSEEETETSEDAAEESDDSEDTDAKKDDDEEESEAPAGHKREKSSDEDTEEEESEESDESTEEDDSDEDDESTTKSKKDGERTVPYSLLKAQNKTIKELKAALAAKADAIKEGDADAEAESTEEIETLAKDLAENHGMDKDGVKEILKAVLKITSKKNALPKDVLEKLKDLEVLKNESMETKEKAHFDKEWKDLDISRQFPNAPKSALKEAQDYMDKLSHSEKFHKYDLDYILFKNKDKFETILKTAAKPKSGEKLKRIGKEKEYNAEDESDEDLVDIEDLNPQIMKQRELKERGITKDGLKTKDYKIYNPRSRED